MIDLHTPTAVQRLVKLYRSADTDALAYGQPWYSDRHDEASDIAESSGLTTRQVAGIIAALSPRNPWKRNLEQAHDVAHGRTVTGLSRSIGKAYRIQQGEDWNDVLNGPKERAFADNIDDPTASTSVTIDVWANRALFPPDTPSADTERWLKRKTSYARAERCYRLAAQHCNVPPHVLQAVVWCVIRGAHD